MQIQNAWLLLFTLIAHLLHQINMPTHESKGKNYNMVTHRGTIKRTKDYSSKNIEKIRQLTKKPARKTQTTDKKKGKKHQGSSNYASYT